MARDLKRGQGGEIVRATMRDQTYGIMRRHIMAGHLKPGDVVTSKWISESFGVGTMPAREALRQLVAEGALYMQKNRMAGVPDLSKDEFIDVINMRVATETYTLGLTIKNLTNEDLKRLSRYNGKLEKAAKRGDFESYLEANLDFHFSLYEPCGSRPVMAMIERLWLLSGPRLSFLVAQQGLLTHAVEAHAQLIEELSKRREAKAQKVLAEDIRSAFDYVIDQFDEKPVD